MIIHIKYLTLQSFEVKFNVNNTYNSNYDQVICMYAYNNNNTEFYVIKIFPTLTLSKS